MKMRVDFHEVAVVSELYQAGYRDDGQPFIAEYYFLQVTQANGDRYDHEATFTGARKEFSEEGEPFFIDTRAAALRSALRLRRRIRRAGCIDPSLWSLGRPVYGSKAYQQYGQQDDLAREREEG